MRYLRPFNYTRNGDCIHALISDAQNIMSHPILWQAIWTLRCGFML